MLHLGTIGYGLREFIVMLCWQGSCKGKVYIEEIVLNTVDFTNDVTANCKFIEDDNLANDLARYAEEQKLTDMERVIGTLSETGKADIWTPGR